MAAAAAGHAGSVQHPHRAERGGAAAGRHAGPQRAAAPRGPPLVRLQRLPRAAHGGEAQAGGQADQPALPGGVHPEAAQDAVREGVRAAQHGRPGHPHHVPPPPRPAEHPPRPLGAPRPPGQCPTG